MEFLPIRTVNLRMVFNFMCVYFGWCMYNTYGSVWRICIDIIKQNTICTYIWVGDNCFQMGIETNLFFIYFISIICKSDSDY